MADVHDAATRSRNMAAIKGTNTKPEIWIRRELHKLGFRFRLHCKDLPGKPDLVFPKYKAVVFVNGCFWHHHGCHLFKWPATRPEFWKNKIGRNVTNDTANAEKLRQLGWRIAVVWECALKGKNRLQDGQTIQFLSDWLRLDENSLEIRGG